MKNETWHRRNNTPDTTVAVEPFSIATVRITGEGRFAGLYANIIGGCGEDVWSAQVIGSDEGPIVITSASFEVVAVAR